jgi:hypothetical protein
MPSQRLQITTPASDIAKPVDGSTILGPKRYHEG